MTRPTDAEIAQHFRDLAVHLEAAREAIQSWGDYVEDYYKNKHNFAGDITSVEAAMKAANALADQFENLSSHGIL